MSFEEANERTFGAALSNEFQWRNLYLKEFGCCTYPPPIPKDPSTTAEGVYPLRRQVAFLQRESGSSSSSSTCYSGGSDDENPDGVGDGGNLGKADNFSRTQREGGVPSKKTLRPAPPTLGISGQGGGAREDGRRRHRSTEETDESAAAFSATSRHAPRATGEQFFRLDLSPFTDEHSVSSREVSHHASKRLSGSQRNGQNAVLRKDDFFDTNDVFSTKFFSFLWMGSDVEGETETGVEVEVDGDEPFLMDGSGQAMGVPELIDGQEEGRGGQITTDTRRLTFSRPGLAALVGHTVNTNPRRLPEAVLRLHHQTWTLLMDNRLMAWVHRETADHCQSATQLRQRLLDIIARGPSFFLSAVAGGGSSDRGRGEAFSISSTTGAGLLLPQEDALQRTLESFSPFFVVIAPPAAVQRARDQFHAARRAQLGPNSGRNYAATAAADLMGLPLLTQYSTWREAYENRRRWERVPFAFFLIHDVSFNFAQITALFVQLQLLYTHTHSHTRRCVDNKRESVPLQHDGGNRESSLGADSRSDEERRGCCPLLLMQETTENIVLAFEQSSSQRTLPMLRRVLDFLTDAALDTVTAYRFVSRDALLRQQQFELPGMPAVPTSAGKTTASGSVHAGHLEDPVLEKTADSPGSLESCGPVKGRADDVATTAAATATEGTINAEAPPRIPSAYFEPQRITERDINSLFEVAYWFADTALLNAKPSHDKGTAPRASLSFGVMPIRSAGAMASPRRVSLRTPFQLGFLPEQSGVSGLNTGHGSLQSPSSLRLANPLTLSLSTGSSVLPTQSRRLPTAPGSAPPRKAVHTFAEAAGLLEAFRKPLRIFDGSSEQPLRHAAGRKKRVTAAKTDAERRGSSSRDRRSAVAKLSSPPVSDAFIGFISPIVMLTTYMRMHGGGWLKQLLGRVFERLSKQNVLLYVNTVDLDAAWATLQPVSGASFSATGFCEIKRSSFSEGGAARARLSKQNLPPTSAPTSPPFNAAVPLATTARPEADRAEFLYNLTRLEELICQDILFTLNDFFGLLYGKRAVMGRLPQGLSVLLTQFVSMVHLYMLESVGATRAAAAAATGNATRNRAPRAGPLNNRKSMTGGAAEVPPSRLVEDCLRVCKQRYYAGLRRHGGAGEQVEALASTFRDFGENMRHGNTARNASATAAATASASLPRLLQTIEQHRLAKFLLFDCWILPAMNNAVSLGYLAPDTPAHLRWNVDALARYLKVLIHAPFAKHDRQNFASLSPDAVADDLPGKGMGEPRRRRASDVRNWRPGDRRHGNSKADATIRDQRATRPTVLSIPPYLTGIYDVATGALVRMQNSAATETNTTRRSSATMSNTVLSGENRVASPSTLISMQPVMSNSLIGAEEAHSEGSSGAVSRAMSVEGEEEEEQGASPMQRKNSKWTLTGTVAPATVAARTGARQTEELLTSTKDPTVSVRLSGTAGEAKSTMVPISEYSSRMMSLNGDIASPRPHRKASDATNRQSNLAEPLPADVLMTPIESNSPLLPSQGNFETLASDAGKYAASPFTLTTPNFSKARGSIVRLGAGPAALVTHPYVFMDDAEWLDMSPGLQSLNDNLGLTTCDRGVGGVEEDLGINNVATPPLPFLPPLNEASGLYRVGGGSAGGARFPATLNIRNESMDSGTFGNSPYFDVPALHMLNAFAYAACTDDSDNVVMPEFEVLPSMAASCIDQLYELATDAHPMVSQALQTGTFHFVYDPRPTLVGSGASCGLTSLYSACLSGVLLHPRTAAHVLKNVMDNNAPFSNTLLKPVTDSTALDLLGQLAAHSRDVPMVDVNAVVPLIQSMASSSHVSRSVASLCGTHGSGAEAALPAITATSTNEAVGKTPSANVSRHWERESRRLLREFAFLTTGYGEGGAPRPLVPGLHRPVGPPHPIQMIRAGATRITADTGGVTPMVFDPWWRAMVVALCVKASNMFAECRGEHSKEFRAKCQAQTEEAKRVHRLITSHFIATKGRETGEREAMCGALPKPLSNLARGSSMSPSVAGLPRRPTKKSRLSKNAISVSSASSRVSKKKKRVRPTTSTTATSSTATVT